MRPRAYSTSCICIDAGIPLTVRADGRSSLIRYSMNVSLWPSREVREGLVL